MCRVVTEAGWGKIKADVEETNPIQIELLKSPTHYLRPQGTDPPTGRLWVETDPETTTAADEAWHRGQHGRQQFCVRDRWGLQQRAATHFDKRKQFPV